MKNLFILFLLSASLSFATDKNPTKSSINAVIVFVDGAQITRSAKISLPIGTTEFSFIKLSPFIQEKSIQISGLDNASILSINYAINHLTKQDKTSTIENLQNEVEKLNDAIRLEEDVISGFEEELLVIKENRKLGNDNQLVNLEKLQKFAAYYRKRITEINVLIHKSLKKKRDYSKQIGAIKNQLSELNVHDKIQTGEIKVKLNTSINKQLNLIVKYNVTNAGWFPIYDLKAKSINNPLNLDYKAHVYQSTGVSWNNVKLTLSTNDPNTNNLKPDVNTKYLNFISRYSSYNAEKSTKNYNHKYNPFVKNISGIVTDASGTPLPGVNVIAKGTSIGTSTNFDGMYSIKPNGAKQLDFSYIGFSTETLPIHSSVMNLSLDEDVSVLDEVVVVGYGTSEKRDITGAISSVKSESITNALQGRVAGVQVRGTSLGDKITEGITNTNFEIQKLSTVESDGNITVIEIEKFIVPATFAYFTAPVVNENVFLTAKIGNWQQYNLLPGEVNIYFEDSYSGITNINPYSTTDSLTVSLGIDPNVAIKRKPINNFKKTNFIGNNRVIDKSYEIEIKNNKSSAIDVLIVDRIPVSQNKDIKIDDIDSGNSNYDSKKGILKWKVNIDPKASNNYKFSYTVKYPKYKKINL